MSESQLDMPTDEPTMFATDETIDRRLRQVENAVADFEARLPAVRRELETLLDLAHPERHQAAGEPAPWEHLFHPDGRAYTAEEWAELGDYDEGADER